MRDPLLLRTTWHNLQRQLTESGERTFSRWAAILMKAARDGEFGDTTRQDTTTQDTTQDTTTQDKTRKGETRHDKTMKLVGKVI